MYGLFKPRSISLAVMTVVIALSGATSSATAQEGADVSHDLRVRLNVILEDKFYQLETFDSQRVITPSGNRLLVARFEIEPGSVSRTVHVRGIPGTIGGVLTFDTHVVANRSGFVLFVVHLNGDE